MSSQYCLGHAALVCHANHILAADFYTSELKLLALAGLQRISGSFSGMLSCMFSPFDGAQGKIFLEIIFSFQSSDGVQKACFTVFLELGQYYISKTLAHFYYRSITYYWHQFMGSC